MNAKMIVSIVSTYSTKCGISFYTRSLARGLVAAGVDVQIIAENVWRKNSVNFPFVVLKAIINRRSDVVHIQHEYLLFGRGEYNLLLLPLLLLLRLLRIPCLITMHSVISRSLLSRKFFSEYTRSSRFLVVKRTGVIILTTFLACLSKLIIVHTRKAKEILCNEYFVRSPTIYVIPHGSETHYPIQEKRPREKKHRTVLFFGFVKPSKGVHTLIRSIALISGEYPDLRLLIVGECPIGQGTSPIYIQELRQLANELAINDKVEFLDRYISDEESLRLIGMADIIVLPYEDEVEGESGVLKKVCPFGKPVIASDVGKFREVLSDGEDGLLFKRGDEGTLAAAMIKLLSDCALADRLGKNLKKLAARHSWHKVAAQTISLYKMTMKFES